MKSSRYGELLGIKWHIEGIKRMEENAKLNDADKEWIEKLYDWVCFEMEEEGRRNDRIGKGEVDGNG